MSTSPTPVPAGSVFQIFISETNAEPPELLAPAIASVQQCFGAYNYVRHSGESLRAFI